MGSGMCSSLAVSNSNFLYPVKNCLPQYYPLSNHSVLNDSPQNCLL